MRGRLSHPCYVIVPLVSVLCVRFSLPFVLFLFTLCLFRVWFCLLAALLSLFCWDFNSHTTCSDAHRSWHVHVLIVALMFVGTPWQIRCLYRLDCVVKAPQFHCKKCPIKRQPTCELPGPFFQTA